MNPYFKRHMEIGSAYIPSFHVESLHSSQALYNKHRPIIVQHAGLTHFTALKVQRSTS